MNNVVKDILEKMKKVEDGPLDREDKGEDEQNFIDKHVDNVEVTDTPVLKKTGGHPHSAGEKQAMAPRKKHRKGYEPGEDAKVYEELSLEESTDIMFELIEEAITDFLEEDATEEEAAILSEILSSEENYEEFIDMMFEEKCEDCGCEECECDDDDDEVIDDNPKIKKEKGKKVNEDIERHADVKLVKVKTPEGKVVFRKQRAETEVSKKTD